MVLLLVKGGKRCGELLLFAYFGQFERKEIEELSRMRNNSFKD